MQRVNDTVEVPTKGVYLVRDGVVDEIGIKEAYAGPNVHIIWMLDCQDVTLPDFPRDNSSPEGN